MKNKMNLPTFKMMQLAVVSSILISCAQNEEIQDEEIRDIEETVISINKENNTRLQIQDQNISSCPNSGQNPDDERIYTYEDLGFLQSEDVNDASNSGTTKNIDDRTCQYNYTQKTVNNGSFGSHIYGEYRIKAGTNDQDSNNLQPRIERESKKVNSPTSGEGLLFSGYVLVKSVGNATNNLSVTDLGETSGTYIVQAKAKDNLNNPAASSDPAIALVLVKPGGTDSNGKKLFDYYMELVTKRSTTELERKVVNLNFSANENTPVKVEFENKINSGGDHKIVIKLTNAFSTSNTITRYFTTPNGSNTTQLKTRFGAYRCKSGEARIMWRDGISIDFI